MLHEEAVRNCQFWHYIIYGWPHRENKERQNGFPREADCNLVPIRRDFSNVSTLLSKGQGWWWWWGGGGGGGAFPAPGSLKKLPLCFQVPKLFFGLHAYLFKISMFPKISLIFGFHTPCSLNF